MSREKIINNIVPDGFSERGARLELWWKSKGWNKVEFAKRMNIWPQNVNKYFTGELDPANLIEQLIKEDCNIVWIIDGKTDEKKGMVAETLASYGKKKKQSPEGISTQTKTRIGKLAKLLEAEPEKTDEEMLDLLIKTMEEKQKKRNADAI